jgi:hypothetical protein
MVLSGQLSDPSQSLLDVYPGSAYCRNSDVDGGGVSSWRVVGSRRTGYESGASRADHVDMSIFKAIDVALPARYFVDQFYVESALDPEENLGRAPQLDLSVDR